MPNVLIIDDSATTRMFYRATLEAAGFEVDEAANGLEGLEKTMLAPFDLVIVDVNMPKMDGFSFVRLLRRSAEAASVPALIITTEAGAEDFRQGRLAGANFYLVKPVAQTELVRHVSVLTGAAM